MNLFELFLPSRKAIMEGIDHPEDLIISQGSAGADRVLKDLASLEKDPATVTVKWDGFPAVVFGRDKAGNLVFVDKHMYEKVVAGKIEFTTIKDYDMSRDANRSSLWEHESVLRPALDKIVPNVKDQYWMGDLMWTGTPPTQEGYFVFKPNTVEYRVKIDDTPGRGDTLSDNIARSVGGIAVHTYINGLGSADSPLVGLKGLAENAGITFLVGEMKDKPQVAVDKNLIAQAQATINEHKTAVDEFYKQLTAMKAKTVVTNMGPFITRMLEENDIQNNIVPRFLEFLKERLTDSAAAKMLGDNKNGWLYQQDGGAPGLLGVWTMWATVVDVKLHIKQQIDTQQQGSEVIAVTDGINAHEGYVFGAGKDKLKLIDRLGFSRANFAKHKVPDEEIEQKSKMPLAAFCFGRMNPPTRGHELVMQKTLETGGENAFIFLSNSNNPDTDPLDPKTKAAFISKMYPNFAGHIVTDYVQGPIYAANWLYQKGFRNMAFVAGSDRLGKEKGSIEKLLTGWNSGPIRSTDPAGAREHVVMQYVSSGQRDPDAEGVTGYSGSKARAAAEANNEQQFQQYTGVGSDIVVNGKTLYQATRDGMGIQDEPAQQPAPAQQAVQKAQPKTQVTKKVPGHAPMKDKLNQPMESVLRDKDDLQAKRKALQDIQMDPNTGNDPELAKELIRRKHALEREAKTRGLAESIVYEVNSLGEDNFGTSVKRPARPGSRPERVKSVKEGDVVQFPKKHKGDISDMHSCPKCGGDLQGGKYMGHQVQVCMPCKQVYLPPNSGIDQQGNKIENEDISRRGFLKGAGAAALGGAVGNADAVAMRMQGSSKSEKEKAAADKAREEEEKRKYQEIVQKYVKIISSGQPLPPKMQHSYDTMKDFRKDVDTALANIPGQPGRVDYEQRKNYHLMQKEGVDERSQNALWAQITAHEKAAKKSKDLKQQHHLKMADQLRSQLKTSDQVDEIAGAFPSPSTRAKWAADAAASNAAEAKRLAAKDAERLKSNTELVDKEQKINHHSLDATIPTKEARANTASARAGLAKRKETTPLSPEEQAAKDKAKSDKWLEKERAKMAAKKKVSESPIEMDPQNPNDPMVMPPGLNPGKLSYRKSRAANQLAELARMAAQANEKDSPAMWDSIVKHFPELETNIRSIQHGMQELEARRRKGGVASKGITKV